MKSNEFNPSELIELLETLKENIQDVAFSNWDSYTDIYICEESFHEAFETRSMFSYEREMMRKIDEQIKKLESLNEDNQ